MTQKSKLTNSIICLACFIVIIAGIKASTSLVIPFLLSVFIAIISAPLLFFLVEKKVPTALALGLIIILILVVISLMGVLVGSSVNDFSKSMPEYQKKFELMSNSHVTWLKERGLNIPNHEQLFKHFDPSAALTLAANTLKELSGVLGNAFLILLTVIFMLLEASSLPRKIKRSLGEDTKALQSLSAFAHSIKSYVSVKTNMSLLTAICIYIALLFLEVDYALLWGVLTFFLNYVPNIGSVIAAVPYLLLALLQHGFGVASIAAIITVFINVVIGTLIEPRFMGKELGLSTLVVFLSLVFWGWVLGPVGMILSVPLTMAFKIGLENNEDSKWISSMLGSE